MARHRRPRAANLPLRRDIAMATACVLLFSGGGLVGVSIASQRDAPSPPAAVSTAVAPQQAPGLVTSAQIIPRAGNRPLVGRAIEGWAPKVAGVSPPSTPADERPLTLQSSVPVTLDIPAIDVHSVVQHLGQEQDGTLETPATGPHYNEAAWYRHSPTPGALGPSILMGHVDSAAEGPSVFFRLGELKPGDRVAVTRADKSVAVFTVDNVRRYAKSEFPTNLVYRNINHAGLRILTCGGAFDDASGHYLDNIVVFASLAESQDS